MGTFFTTEVEGFLSRLVSACGVSGNTQEVSALLETRFQAAGVKTLPDPERMGFFQSVVNPEGSFRVMLGSHMDAVGLRIVHVDNDGFCYMRAVGGIDLLSIKGHRMRVHTSQGLVPAIVQGPPLHHTDEEARHKPVALDAFYLRTPFTHRAATASPIRIGDPVTFDQGLHAIGEEIICGPGLDNRLGTLLMSEITLALAREKTALCLYGVATSGEEIGLKGVRSLTQKIAPQLAIALDVTSVTDYPQANHRKLGSQKLGAGPVIARGYNTRSIYNDLLLQTAEECSIAHQLRAEDSTPTDGREMDEAGVPTVVIRVPATMLHTASDAVYRRDIEATAALTLEFLRRLAVKKR